MLKAIVPGQGGGGGGGGTIGQVKDTITTVTNATEIYFTHGATVTDMGGGVAGVSVSGAGGSFSAGLGIDPTALADGTISNTGTIVQPQAGAGLPGNGIIMQSGLPGAGYYSSYGIYIQGPTVTNPGTAGTLLATTVLIYTGDVTITNSAGIGVGGAVNAICGMITNGTDVATGGAFFISGGGVYPGSAQGAGGNFVGGYGHSPGGYGRGGDWNISGGPGSNQGGDVTIGPGIGGDSNGVLIVPNIGTTDPHILNAKFQVSVAGVGYVGVYSKG
jgi:hypothetical protein